MHTTACFRPYFSNCKIIDILEENLVKDLICIVVRKQQILNSYYFNPTTGYYLQFEKLWKFAQNQLGYSRIIPMVTADCMFEMISDHMKKQYSFSKPLTVVISDCKEWAREKNALDDPGLVHSWIDTAP